jgi:hypothetical protein
MRKRVMTNSGILLLGVLGLGTWAEPGRSQVCPSQYSACDNGGCCPSAGQCCELAEDGCCGSATPYCCADGRCAASPGLCGGSGVPVCPGYAVPCGNGCAPAGSDCCGDGNYCDPETKCESPTTCVVGTMITPTAVVTPTDIPEPGEGLISPIADPEEATARSCAISGPLSGSGQGSAPVFLAALVATSAWLTRRRS